jgi:hypothetical protein
LLVQKSIKKLFDVLVEEMQEYNKREKDEQVIDLAFRCFECLNIQGSEEKYVD